MAKKILKKFIPNSQTIIHHKYLRIFKKFFSDPFLWHFNRYSVATACSVGFFVGYMPFPGHMILATIFSICFKANLPLSIALVWISNPLTIPPMFYYSYKVGATLLHQPHESFHFEMSYHWFFHELNYYFEPLLLGSIVCGAVLALIGNLSVRLAWRYSVSLAWKKRQKRQNRHPIKSPHR